MIDHYNAFISYRHAPADIRVAETVQRSLEHFHIPRKIQKQTGKKRIQRIFRDKDELPITSNLTDTISHALEVSDYLIVICSTSTKESIWVQREIEFFLRNHTKNQILTVLVDGEDPYEVIPEILQYDEANKIGKNFLEEKGFPNMKETYYLKQNGIITINYAYLQDNVIIYPDLIKLKVALDDGEILGIETTGYLNNHEERDISNIKITKEKAKEKLNKNLEIQSEGLAIIPTNWKTEILCYEFKGKIDNREFLVYINAENGKEEDILIITNTPNGTLTM